MKNNYKIIINVTFKLLYNTKCLVIKKSLDNIPQWVIILIPCTDKRFSSMKRRKMSHNNWVISSQMKFLLFSAALLSYERRPLLSNGKRCLTFECLFNVDLIHWHTEIIMPNA